MSMNIVEDIIGQFGPQILSKIGDMLGQTPGQAQSSIGAAVPAILAGLASTAARPDGADKLAAAVQQQDGGWFGNLASQLEQGVASDAAKQGNGLLGSLLGQNGLSGLTDAIGQFTGAGHAGAGSLLGMLAPVVMGSLANAKPNTVMDGRGIANLLSSQKQNIAAAMPTGLGNLLSSTGLLDGIGGARGLADAGVSAVRNTAGAAVNAGQSAMSSADNRFRTATNDAAQATDSTGSWLRWVLPLAAALVVLWAAYPFLTGQGNRPATTAQTVLPNTTTTTVPNATALAPTTAIPPVPERTTTTTTNPVVPLAGGAAALTALANEALTLNGTNIGQEFATVIDGLKTSLGGITDASSAEAALPRLRQLQEGVNATATTADQLPAAGKTALATLIEATRPELEAVINRVSAMPGVGPLIKPVVDEVNAKLDDLSKGAA